MPPDEIWPFLALGFSFCGAIIIAFNQTAKLPSHQAVIWRLFGVLPLSLISLYVLPWPTNAGLYIGAALLGIILAFSDIRLYRASAVFGARITALYMPLKIALAFCLWAAIAPSSLQPLVDSPGRALLLIGAFILGWVALLHIRRNDTSPSAMKAILPVAAGLAVADIVAKLCLPVTADTTLLPLLGQAIAVVTVGCLSAAATIYFQSGLQTPTRQQAFWSLGLGLLHLSGLSLLLLAISLAPNPGYVGAITILSAVWLAIYAHYVHGEKNNLWAGLLLVFAGGVVAWATAF